MGGQRPTSQHNPAARRARHPRSPECVRDFGLGSVFSWKRVPTCKMKTGHLLGHSIFREDFWGHKPTLLFALHVHKHADACERRGAVRGHVPGVVALRGPELTVQVTGSAFSWQPAVRSVLSQPLPAPGVPRGGPPPFPP